MKLWYILGVEIPKPIYFSRKEFKHFSLERSVTSTHSFRNHESVVITWIDRHSVGTVSAVQLTGFVFFPDKSRFPCHRHLSLPLVRCWLACDRPIRLLSFDVSDERCRTFCESRSLWKCFFRTLNVFSLVRQYGSYTGNASKE